MTCDLSVFLVCYDKGLEGKRATAQAVFILTGF